jgi:hypothetical protein
MTRGERRYRTRRAIDRKVRRYLNQFSDLVDGCWYSVICGQWIPLLSGPPHKYHKKSIIDRFSDPWAMPRPDRTPKVADWDDEPVCFGGSQWCDRITACTCDACAYLDYISFDPFDDPYDLSEWILAYYGRKGNTTWRTDESIQ